MLALLAAWPQRQEILRRALEIAVNRSAGEFFEGPVRLKSAALKRNWRLSVTGFEGRLKTRKEPVPMEINRIESLDPLTYYLFGAPVRFAFEGVRPAKSPYRGLEGVAWTSLGPNGTFELEGHVREMGLEDIEWINPENLHGSTGKMAGMIRVKAGAHTAPYFSLDLQVGEPGGTVKAQFFDLLVPFLPQYEAIARLRALSAENRLVRYRSAQVQAALAGPGKMKVFLHILIPDYNLNLNLNLEVRIDEENAFLKLAQIMGLVEVAWT